MGTLVHTKKAQNEKHPGHSHIWEVSSWVFYNSNYSRNIECHLVTTSKLDCTPYARAQNARKMSGKNKNAKPPSKNQYTGMACTDKISDTNLDVYGSAARQVEVSTESPQQNRDEFHPEYSR